MLQGKHITFSYPEPAKGKTDVLADVSFEIREHDFIGLIGASGSGKTTLIKHLNGLLKAESGEILFKGENIYSNTLTGNVHYCRGRRRSRGKK